ncbi:Glyoxalase-like domain-containing protein [Thermomonospora echinospora]|uniref:Glyoxalase-like domain-containing protein n=1 Tax=Thermomonospora echinospora TaxID=1992 RepID=A0A1H6DU30_9ACTN|nr:VOC family protein [Thermomonospora echinospora]SEG88760.1 Glyoxalase-like domain-containing protein [Thermomonospora echinospora]
MRVYGMAWVGSRTPRFESMRDFLADVVGLPVGLDQPDAVVFDLPDGDAFEVFKPTDTEHSFFDHPVAGLLVDDVREARAELQAHGIEFIGDVHVGVETSWATEWSHFRAPDGHVYVLVSRPAAHPGGSRRAFDELRICLRVRDLDAAVRVYRDGLGLPIVDEWTHPGGQRGVLFAVAPAAIELFDEAQWDLVDDSETGSRHGRDHALRVEVRDEAELRALAARLAGAGAPAAGELVDTPWEQRCLRVAAPEGEQLTLFVLPDEERRVRESARRLLPR